MKILYKIIFLFILISNGCVLNAKSKNCKINPERPLKVVVVNNIVNNLILPTATVSGTTTVCQNAVQPQITFTGSGGTAPYTFTYHINSDSPQTIVTTGTNNSVSVAVNTSSAGSFTYTLDSVYDSTAPTTEQPSSGTATVVVKSSPDASMGGTGSGSNFNGVPVFKICSNAVSTFSFTNTSSTISLNSNYTINWGDGSPDFNSTSWAISTHTYPIGLWNLVYTIQGNNGCNTTKNYIVFVGSNPAVSLGNPGNTDICNSSSLTFPITGTINNPPGTTYTVSFNDGSSSQIFNHPPPSSVTHTFSKSSCGTTSTSGSGATYSNSFSANIKAENPCGTSEVGVVPIYVSTPPTANFTLPTTSCVNTAVCMTNSSTGAYEINSSSCITTPKIIWSISPATGFSINSGSLGNDFSSSDPNLWLTGSNTLCLNFSQEGTYTITINTGNRCGSDTEFKTICIESPLIPQFTLDNNSGCSPQTVIATNTTVTTNSCTTPIYTWSATFAPSSCGSSITTIPIQLSTHASFNFTEPGTYTIKLTATNSCGNFSTSQIVTVTKPPTAAINPIASLCQTSASTTISPTAAITNCGTQVMTYSWNFPGGTPPNSTLAVPGVISYATAGNYTVLLTVTNECGLKAATNKSFTINPSPVIAGNLFSCVGFTSQLTGSVTAAAVSPWTSSAPSVATVNSSGLVTGISGGTATITYTNSNNCKTTELFTVNPAPTITSQPASSIVCLGGTPTILSVAITGATGTPQYQWYSNSADNTTAGILISGEINATYTPPSGTAGNLYYYCIITLPSGGCSNIKTNTAQVTIIPNVTITTQPTPTQNLCVGVTIPVPLTSTHSGGTGTTTYQWYSNTMNSTIGGSPIASATTASYIPPVFSVPGNYYYYATVSPNGNGCLPATTNVAEIVVFTDPTISVQPIVSQTLCQNALPINLDVTAIGGNGAFNYQWYSNLSNSNTGGTLIPGATSNSYSPPTNLVSTKYYYCAVSQSSTSGCSVTSATATINVLATPTITQPASSTICLGGIPAVLSITVSGAIGIPQYQWYSNTANNTTTGTAIPGETNTAYSPPSLAVGTTYYYCIITLPSGGCSSITSNTAIVIIDGGATINTQPTPTQSLCVGNTISTPLGIAFSGGAGTASYQWFSNTTNTITGGTLVAGATSANYTPPVFTTSGNYYYYTFVTFSGNGCGPITSDVAEIVIVANPVVTSQPLTSQTICKNVVPTSLSVTVSGGISAVYTYQWFSNINNNTTSGNIISGATNDSYSPPTGTPGTRFYYCEIKQTNGSGCNVASTTATVIVNLSPVIVSQPVSSTICIGQTPSLLSVSYVNGVGTPMYQWFSNSTNTIVGGTIISGALNATYSPQNSTAGTIYYYCIITLPTGGCSSLTSSIATVTTNPYPVISNRNTLICSNNAFTITPDALGGDIVPSGTTYTWANPYITPVGSITGTSAQTTPQTTINQTLINTTTSPATVTYTVTPLSGSCTGLNFTIVVTVNPAISPNVASTNSTCFGIHNGAIQTNIIGGIPFSSGTPYQISWNGPNGFTSSASNISNLAPGNYNLSITDAGGCPYNETYLITEPDPIVIVTDLEKDITCFNDANGAIKITISGGTVNYNFAWTKNGTAYANTEDLSSLSPGVYGVTVSDANNCAPKTATFNITEPAVLTVNLVNKTNILCFGQPTGAIAINVVGGTSPYSYAWTGPNSFSSSGQNLNAIFAGTYNLLVTDNLGCTKALAVLLTQTPEISIVTTATPIVCYGNNNASINTVVSGGVAPYQISWSNLGSGTFQDNLSAGDYLITVTDALNCVKTLNVVIPEAPIFTINPVVKNISCFGDHNGSIDLNIVGGIAPVKLTWSDNSVAGTVRNNLGPGSYTVTISDGKPCTIVRTFIILEPQLLVLSANVTNAFDCDNANSGAINLLVAGGSAPFTYSWSNGATTEDLSNIPAGNYLVTVKDANGCSKQAQYNINRPPPIVTGVATKTDFNCETKYIKQTFVAQVSGGVPPYQLTWSSGDVSGTNNEMMNTNQNGTVILYVTDNQGCKANYTFNIDLPLLGTPSFNASSYAYSTYGTYSINDPVQFSNTATGDFITVAWDFGDGTFSTELNPVHAFINPKDYVVTQTVTYPFGCTYLQKTTFIVDKGYLLVVPNAFTPNNDNLNDTFRPVTKALKNVRLDIYDTWGSMIYSETGDVLRGWDAKIKGFKAENGNYFCKVSGETFYGTIVNENHPFVLIK